MTIIYTVQSANSLLPDKGYGKAQFDAEHPCVLVTFADADFRARTTILPKQLINQPTTEKEPKNEQVHRQP